MSSFEHEKALRGLGITAEVIHDGTDRVLVGLSVDALDQLIDQATEAVDLDLRLDTAETEAHSAGQEIGEETGYENACIDIRGETGEAWDIVKPMLERAFEDGHETACDEFRELGES